MRIQHYDDYRRLIRETLKKVDPLSRGQVDRLAKALKLSPSQMSQIFSGRRDLTLEQVCGVATHLRLTDLEAEYLLLLVQIERTSSVELKKLLRAQLERVRKLLEQHEEQSSMSSTEFVLSEGDQGIFYSQWYYSAIRLLTAIPGMNAPEKIASRLQLPDQVVNEVLEFLVRSGLCVRQGGALATGPARTYTKRGSPFHSRHRLNWRIKALESLPNQQLHGLSYTAAVSISAEDALRIRSSLIEATEKAEAMIDASPAKTLYCLNIDWFEL